MFCEEVDFEMLFIHYTEILFLFLCCLVTPQLVPIYLNPYFILQ